MEISNRAQWKNAIRFPFVVSVCIFRPCFTAAFPLAGNHQIAFLSNILIGQQSVVTVYYIVCVLSAMYI